MPNRSAPPFPATTPGAAPGRRGFTLIELLVVLLVIAILAGLLFPIVGIARGAGQKAKTTSIVQNAASALIRYRSLNGSYPDAGIQVLDTDDQAVDLGATDETWSGAEDAARAILGAALMRADNDNFGPGSPHMRATDTGLGEVRLVVDAWEKPLNYRPFTRYDWDDGAAAPIDSADPPKPDSFQLWSAGPDGLDDRGQDDDIGNWER